MNILGKLPESTAPSGTLDGPALLKVLRTALITAASAVLGVLLTWLTSGPVTDNPLLAMAITMVLVPILEMVRRWLADYSA